MPRQKSLVTVIRELVRTEVSNAIQGLLSATTGKRRRKSANGRRRRRRRGPGRPPGSKNKQ